MVRGTYKGVITWKFLSTERFVQPQPEPGRHFGLPQRAVALRGSCNLNSGSCLSRSRVPAAPARTRPSRALWSCLAWLLGTALSVPQGHAAIAYIQENYAVPQSPQAQVTVPFTGAQAVGNLNVVVIGWSDATSHVVSVSDTRANVYSAALSPTVQSGIQTQVIYYAAGIAAAAAGANTVTVNFDAAVSYPDVRIAEYGGISATTPVDVAAGASGTGTTSSVTLATTNANDLLVAGDYVQTSTTAAGAGYTNRVITSPDGSILEDRTVTAAGTYSATASLSGGGGWVMQLVAFRGAGAGGTPPPTAPGGLTAPALSSSQIGLSWTASTGTVAVTGYLIERCQGSGCTSFAQVATSTSTSYSDTALPASTHYLYRGRATDAAGNTSGYSTTASATTNAGASPPTAPTGLTATATSSTQVGLSWTASTGTLTVTGYLIERCIGSGCTSFAQIGTSTSTAYADANLTPASTYVYRVRATDSGGNLSPYSATASATTPADTQPPTAPSGLTATAVSNSQIGLSWTASTDNVGVTGYLIERCPGSGCASFAQVATSTSTSYSDTGLTAATTYLYRVRATDAAGNLSSYSGTASARTAATAAALAYIQSAAATPQTSQLKVSATFGAAQTAGNTIVVFVGWYNTTSAVQSVTDTAGNSYQLVSGPATDPSAGTQAAYYATNIHAAAASSNSVTVTFSAAAPYPDLRVAEYAGVDVSNPIDGGIEGTGSGIMSVAGPLPTAWPYDLLVAGNYVTTLTAGAGANFTPRLITSPDGSILEDRIVSATGSYSATAPLTASGSWIMQLLALRGASPPSPDTTPPVVSISAPAAGAVLSGTVAISVSATDPDSPVTGVQLKIAGLNVGIPDTTSPFTISFDTSQLANGTHTLSAYAWDASHNIGTSQPVSVTFNNSVPGNPAQTGLWSGLLPWPLVAIHLNLLPNGRVIAWDQFATGVSVPYLWDPVTSGFTAAPTNDAQNLFCSGHVVLKDGRLLVAGGELNTQANTANSFVGLNSGHIFDPATNTWTSTPNMAYGRWYPNLTTLPDGRVLTLVGVTTCQECIAAIPEIYDPVANTWTQLTNASNAIPWYPYTYVLPDGRVLVTGSAEEPIATSVLNVATQTWSTVDPRLIDGGSAAMYLPGKFMKAGTSSATVGPVTSSVANTYVLDMTAASPAWVQTASMAFPRTFHVFAVLPDGTVLVTGGGRTTAVVDSTTAVYPAELWSPATQSWTTLASMNTYRQYHQTAILLPDARVLVTGSGRGLGQADPTDRLSGEVFTPPYLFKGPRPTIASAPSQLSYAQSFTVQTPDAASIATVALIHLGTMTHTFAMDQRYVPLTFTAGSGSLTVSAPANANLAPPGYYMLFLVNSSGVPSVAQILKF